MWKLQKLWFFFLLGACALLTGCEKWNTPNITDVNLPDNAVVSIISKYANEINMWKSQITQEEFQWHNFADPENTWYNILWYSIEKSGIKNDNLPDTAQFFDGRHAEYVWDEIWWSMIEYMKDGIICYNYLFYDQEIPDELMVWEWDYDEEEFIEKWNDFQKDLTYNTKLICGFIPKWAPLYQNLYFNAFGEEPYWNMSIRWNSIMRFDADNADYYYISSMNMDGDNINFDWYDIQWEIIKESCIDGGKWDTHEYKIQVVIQWDMAYMWCADKFDSDFMVWEEWTLWNFVKKTNYQYKWTTKREHINYDILDMTNNYVYVSLFENNTEDYDPIQIIMEKTDDGRKVLYEWSYDIDPDTCEELNQYDHDLMEMFFLRNCPRW